MRAILQNKIPGANLRSYWMLIVFLLSACSYEPEQSIRLAHVSWPGYELLTLADDKGMYKGVNVKAYRVVDSVEVIRAFEQNVINVAALTLDEVILLQSRLDEVLEVIAVLDISDGGDAIVAHKDVASLAELIDKRIGVQSTGLGAFMFSKALDMTENLEINQLHIVPAEPDQHYDLFMERKVDAVVTYEPVKSRLLEQGGHVLFDSSMIPNEIVDVLVVRRSFAEANPGLLLAFIKGYYKALSYSQKYPEAALSRMADFEGVDVNNFKKSLTGIKISTQQESLELLGGERPFLAATIKTLQEFLYRKKILVNQQRHQLELTDRFLVK